MAEDLAKSGSNSIQTLAVHPGYVATKMTGYHGEDDMETCMAGLCDLIERFGTEMGRDIPNGGYFRWNGEAMPY
jgi:NAD(P)-dependent dehydrogenase (short-subunit alcohol dehydrogenase family)